MNKTREPDERTKSVGNMLIRVHYSLYHGICDVLHEVVVLLDRAPQIASEMPRASHQLPHQRCTHGHCFPHHLVGSEELVVFGTLLRKNFPPDLSRQFFSLAAVFPPLVLFLALFFSRWRILKKREESIDSFQNAL
jgi:hypothetical protein